MYYLVGIHYISYIRSTFFLNLMDMIESKHSNLLDIQRERTNILSINLWETMLYIRHRRNLNICFVWIHVNLISKGRVWQNLIKCFLSSLTSSVKSMHGSYFYKQLGRLCFSKSERSLHATCKKATSNQLEMIMHSPLLPLIMPTCVPGHSPAKGPPVEDLIGKCVRLGHLGLTD